MERAARTASNALFNLLGAIYPMVLTVVLTPVFLHYIGTAGYGVYALSIVLLSTLSILEFGLGIALMKFLPEHIARGEQEAAVGLVRAGVAFYGLVGIVGALTSAFMGIFFVQSLFGISAELAPAARLAFVLAGVAFALTMLLSPFGAVIGSLQRFDIVMKIKITTTTVGAAVSVGLLMLGFGLNGIMASVALQPALGLMLYIRAARARMPGLRLTPKLHTRSMQQLLSFSLYTVVGNISGMVLFHLDKFVLGVVSGVALVTFYVVPGALAQRLHAAASTMAAVTLPTASELLSRGDRPRVHALYRRATWLTALFLVSAGTPAGVFASNILEHWVGSSFEERSTETLQILIATFVLLGLTAVPYWMLLAAGRPRIAALFNVATASINVVAIFLLVPSYGVVGAALAYLISMLGVPVFIWYAERRVLELARSPWPGIAARLGTAVMAQLPVCFALRPLADNLPLTIGLVLLCMLVAPAVLYLFGFIEAEDKALLGRLFGRRPAAGATP